MKILSIDGGGIRGVIPAKILAQIEERTGKQCYQMFDMIVGTSTGGILALGLSLGYTAKSLLRMYIEEGPSIFEQNIFRRLRTLNYMTNAKYDSENLEQVLYNYFMNYTMKDLKTNCMITAYDIKKDETIFFKSWKEEFKNELLKDIARSTSAAPTFFKPYNNKIDGGVYNNNPALSAYVTALKNKPSISDEIFMLSLGTGEVKLKKDNYKSLIDWAKGILGIMMNGQSVSTDYHLDVLLGYNYQRLSPKIPSRLSEMDNCKNIPELLGITIDYINRNELSLKIISDKLTNNI